MIWGTNARRGLKIAPVSPGDFAEWKQKNTVFQDIASSYDNQVTLTGAGNPQFLSAYNLDRKIAPVSPGDFAEWKQKNTVFQDIASSYDNQVTLTGAGNPQFLSAYN